MFFIEVPDTEGNIVKVEVSKEVHDVFQEDEKKKNALTQADFRHLSHEEIQHSTTQHKQFAPVPSLEEQFFTKLLLADLEEVLLSCTKVQQKRFYQKKILGYTYEEIAKLEGCSHVAVRNSVLLVEKKIKKFLEDSAD